jgi:signal transduction histidine kinase
LGLDVKRSLRTLLVVALLLVALGVPTAAWFVSGSREAERESQRVVDDARAEARVAAQNMARQLGAGLEKVRASESQRPYFHYQNLIHDPRGASQGLSVVPSPLAQGPTEPLILTHFQIDPKGTVTMPTLNDEVRDLNAPDVARERSMRQALTVVAPQLLQANAPALTSLEAQVTAKQKEREAQTRVAEVRRPAITTPAPPTPTPAPAETLAQTITSPSPTATKADTRTVSQARVTRTDPLANQSANTGRPESGQQQIYSGQQQIYSQNQSSQNNQQWQVVPSATDTSISVVSAATPPIEPPSKQSVSVQKLDPGSFAQNAQSNIVYRELKTPAATAKTRLPARRAPDVEIATSDFAWTSVIVNGKPSLAALRSVVRPDGAVVQGFLISEAALADAAHGAGRLARGSGIPIGGTGWGLDVDEGPAAASAMARANEIRITFRRTFYAGLAAAALALIAVAMVVWRTERLARERSQFAAAAAHELRTPLAGLRLYGDMLAHQLGDPERSRLYAQQVSQEADRLGRVVANMLEFTQLERGSLTVKPQPGDLGNAVRECVEQLRPALEVAGCPVHLSVAEDLPAVAFDRDAVHHIVQNLLDNAEKYSRASADRNVDVNVERLNGHVALTVSDRGSGIDSRSARSLFHPFERGGAGDAPAGLGLGLVLVKALAEAQGGDVSWTPRTEGGTTFQVLLPPFYTA